MRHFIFAAIALTAAAPAIAGTTTLVSDSFDQPSATRFDDANDPLDLSYFNYQTAYASAGLGLSGNNRYLQFSTAAANAKYGSTNFQQTTLGIGDSISLGFSLSTGHTSTSWLTEFSIGLYNSNSTSAYGDNYGNASSDDNGYMLVMRDDFANYYSGIFGRDNAPSLELDTVNANFGNLNFADGAFHDYVLTINRTGINSKLITLSEDGVTILTYTLFNSDNFSFDNIQFKAHTPNVDYKLDNITVTYTSAVPEPASLAVLALGAGATLLRRKR